ncbi:sterile alpha motif domain-containing protein 14 [Ictalurus punctatus]|uniref:Sterile alpha motif domain-containing protein 14 n=1 Tax=Ictalurus punctatus TaxID=7998 RepID=A0A2D0S9A2_ICTPU|nr:sterile alpha motif domain-containing protein 14 [Ictalurus punctatus]
MAMSSTPLAETEEDVFDLTDAVPETERLDSSLQKAKAQLSIKTRRHRPSRSRLRDSLSSTEGEDSLDGKSYSGLLSGSCSPLHVSLRCPSPFADLQPSSSPARKERSFTFDTAESEKKEQRRRSACLLNPSSPTHLLKGDHLQQRREDSSQLCQGDHLKRYHKENSHPHHRGHSQLHQEDHIDPHQAAHLPLDPEDHTHPRQADHIQQHREDHPDLRRRDHLQEDRTHPHKRDQLQEDHTHLHKTDQPHMREKDQVQLHEENHSPLCQREYSQSEDDGRDIASDEPSSPTVLLDKKTRRRFLDLGVTLRRTYGKVRRERANRHAAENREPDGAGSRSTRSSGPPFVPFSWLSERIRGSGSPKNSSQSPAKSEDEELKNDGRSSRTESSQPYQSLSDHSDEGRDERAEARVVKKKTILPFSSGGRDRTEKQNGVQRDKRDDGHGGEGQKLLSSQSHCKHFDL